jgi:hypothetical protein
VHLGEVFITALNAWVHPGLPDGGEAFLRAVVLRTRGVVEVKRFPIGQVDPAKGDREKVAVVLHLVETFFGPGE